MSDRITYRQKRHEPGALGFAAFFGERYLGDVAPIFQTENGGMVRKPPADQASQHIAWVAHPADQPARLPLLFLSRLSAAAALLERMP